MCCHLPPNSLHHHHPANLTPSYVGDGAPPLISIRIGIINLLMKSCFHFTAPALPRRLMRSTSRYRPRSNANTLYVHASMRNASTFPLFTLPAPRRQPAGGRPLAFSIPVRKESQGAPLLFPTRSPLTSVSRVHQRVNGAFSVHGVSPGPSPSSREVISPACCHHLCQRTSRQRSG